MEVVEDDEDARRASWKLGFPNPCMVLLTGPGPTYEDEEKLEEEEGGPTISGPL